MSAILYLWDNTTQEYVPIPSLKGEKSGDVIVLNNTIVNVNDWVSDNTNDKYPYKADITVGRCTNDFFPEVVFELEQINSNNFAPVATSFNGGVTIYARKIPISNITIPSICLIKEVE